MKININIQSVSDIITNSSSEVFISTKNDELFRILEEWEIDYDCYETEEDLRKAVENCSYDFDDLVTYNPYNEWYVFKTLKEYKSSDEIWEFFKGCYTHLIGKIIINVDRDDLYRAEEKHGEYLTKYITE